MDFHSLARRDLQSLCKRNKIPANMTNIAMADALQALQSVEGIAEIQEALQFQSPKKLDLVSPAPLPRTTGRRTASRKVVGPGREEALAEEEPREQQGSPLPRSRRVTARGPEIDEAEEEEGAKKEVPETPKAPNTRRGPSKKEEGAVAEALTATTRRRATKKEAVETPAAVRTGRRASALRAVEVQKEENPAGVTAGRRARQSSKKEVEAVEAADLMSEGPRRSTRVRGRGATVKMTSLAMKEEAQEKVAEADDSVDQKNDDDNEEEEREIKDNEKAIQEAEVSADLNTEEKQEISSDESFELVGEVSENNQNQNQGAEEKNQEEDGNGAVIAGFDGSPIRGLIDQDLNQQQKNPAAEIAAADDGEFELQEPSTTVDLGSDKIAAETAESGEFEGEMMEKSERDTGDNDQTTEITVESPAKCVGDKVTADVTEESGDAHIEITAKTDESDDENGGGLVEISAETTESGEFDGKMEKSERDTGDNDQTTEITVGSPAKCVGDKVTANVTEESGDVHIEITAKIDESDDENGGGLVAVDVPVEIDESGTDLVAGEIAVEAIIEEQKQVPEVAGESWDEVRELIDDLSDLNLSANGEMPPAVSTDNKENGGLTAFAVGPRGAVKQKFESMSLRKLKAVYKETLVTMNTTTNKVEKNRAALKAIDDNCI